MQELYGKLNTVTQQINYSGGSSETATVTVDNKIKKLTTQVLRVPQSLIIKTKDNEDSVFDGSSEVVLDLTTMAQDDLPTVVDLTDYDIPPALGLSIDIGATVYTGNPVFPTVTIIDLDKNNYYLQVNLDYELTISNNIDAGSGDITITFIGEYANLTPVSDTFIINPATPGIEFYTLNDGEYVSYVGQVTLNINGPQIQVSSTFGVPSVTYYNISTQETSNVYPSEAGQYIITATVDSTENYYGVQESLELILIDGVVPEALPYTITYNSTSGKSSIASYTGESVNITLPTTYSRDVNDQPIEGNDYTVTGIGAEAFLNSSVQQVEIPEGYTSISRAAFSGCSALSYISLPSTLTSIMMNAFFGCSSLLSIEIPAGVSRIRTNTFTECSSLTEIYLYKEDAIVTIDADSIPQGVTIYVPYTLLSDYISAYQSYTFAAYDEPPAPAQLPYTFEGSTVTKYLGDETVVVFPSSYSTSTAQQTVSQLFECDAYSLNEELYYWISGNTDLANVVENEGYDASQLASMMVGNINNGLQVVTQHLSYELSGEDSAYNVSITYDATIFIEGNDYTVDTVGESMINVSVDSIGENITSITLPESYTTISGGAISFCESLEEFICLGDITSIGFNAIYNAVQCLKYDFTHCTSVPVLDGGFYGLNNDCVIYVPDALYNDWIVAQNWSDIASHIQPASNMLQNM